MEPGTNIRANSHHVLWLDKLWLCLFDGDSAGLMSPGQIRREHRDRSVVRQREMASILEAEKDINDIHSGLKTIDHNGHLIDTPNVENFISTHQIIENTLIEENLDVGIDAPETMFRSVVKQLSVRDLEKTLNLRKIAILAESIILESPSRIISKQPASAQWIIRWKESVADVINPELQLLWVRMLINELAQPGFYSMGLMSCLLHLSIDDLEMVRIAGKYAFSDFIFNAQSTYFNTDLHRSLFDVLEDFGLLSYQSSNKSFCSTSVNSFELTLVCNNKALKISHSAPDKHLTLPVFKLSRIGRQIFTLFDSDTDAAYLFYLARHIKNSHFNVALGSWESNSLGGLFTEKMTL